MPRNLTGRTIAITGASSGIGAAVAVACAEAGMHVALAARRVDRLEAVAEQVRRIGSNAMVVRCDVTVDADVESFVATAWRELGGLDVAFANAGYGLLRAVMDTTDAEARLMWETNYWGTLRLVRAVVPRMIERGCGHIVINSSAASEIGIPMYSHYSATKAAQDSIAGALRPELKAHGIDVTSVHPIGTHTHFFEQAAKRAGGNRTSLNTPKALMQQPDHVARCILRALRRPKPEVWPSRLARFGLALATAFPRLGDRIIQRQYRDSLRDVRRQGDA